MAKKTPLLTLAQAAKISGIPYSTLAQAAREQRVAALRSGGRWRITLDAITAALDAGHLRPMAKEEA